MVALTLGMPGLRRAPATVDDRPESPALVDRHGRTARDLRISLTEKCSLRCTYCMPAEGLPAIARDRLLSPAEIARLVRIAVRDLGVQDVRFTGGEPLLRADLAEIVARSAAVAGGASLSLTTNGIGLDKRIDALVAAGLTRVNISLDTIDRDHFARLTRRDRLPAVLDGIRAAHAAGLTPVKINAVLLPETLEGAADLLAWSLATGSRLRFIEQMPLDADQTWQRDRLVDAQALLDELGRRFDLTPIGRHDPAAPAEEWAVSGHEIDGRPATVGIIASVTRPFCAACDRTRITAEGAVRSCLFSDAEVDLRALLRGDADDEQIADRWRAAMWAKPAGHGMERADFARPRTSMGAIGG
ncbi:GTP 3',8-cyclase MoaA [Schumannella sp. 10F1B-5-1]|uniref:GTP 3',8-cyclase MoaA n=1 Tax=Schumannella sp. 10F1B-5-1 TaxID=2590780 RepID=UPI001130205C|nr:GTP 3',8-cyclase MoaA [Schumannella sp. 10F1B-5-1]TPW72829.1 GTP 3',8-cyclase MoaA [Schumannella sp. 10F1B-5-1]